MINGEELIEKICKQIRDDDELLYDSNIIHRLSELSASELISLIEEEA